MNIKVLLHYFSGDCRLFLLAGVHVFRSFGISYSEESVFLIFAYIFNGKWVYVKMPFKCQLGDKECQ